MTDISLLTTALSKAPIVPVITLDHVADAVPLADALRTGGMGVVEVTLRTDAALEGIAAMKSAFPEMLVGAGTLVSPGDVDAALSAGAEFLVSPGVTPKLLPALKEAGVPALPGVATASEAMARADDGFPILKLFPAVPVGGLSLLKSWAGPLSEIKFMPTGGISPKNMIEFLALPNVIAVGGSWMVSRSDIANGAWTRIRDIAADAVRMGLANGTD
ncbi:MAG: bifunctional 4-hydroxy-2-oxoglutarate aldolase/2-dehydro-3-deoxy-phosphogluconate aldolase [Pseudomonadota bacterium]